MTDIGLECTLYPGGQQESRIIYTEKQISGALIPNKLLTTCEDCTRSVRYNSTILYTIYTFLVKHITFLFEGVFIIIPVR